MLNNWEKGGIRFAELKFKDFQPHHKKDYDFREVLLGHLSFLKLIKGEDNVVIKKLRHKYNFLNNLIDYSFIKNKKVQNRLEKDNIKMERIFLDEEVDSDEKFISFCTSAFHQIENLINYYYWKKFPNYDDLLVELLTHNINFKKRYKTLEAAKSNFDKISKLNINVLVYLFEKEKFFDRNLSYDRHITMLREIRNDDSHRCSIINIDHDIIKKEYQIIEKDRLDKVSRGKSFEYSNKQARINLNYHTHIFLEQKNYKKIRTDLKSISLYIKKYFA
tara:strand:+ start:193 stop:1020 length:828 start_codon:yes stop_codon:yes gene_type:complete